MLRTTDLKLSPPSGMSCTIGEMGIKQRSKRQQWIEQAMPRLGKETDTAIAADLGVSVRQVQYLRSKVAKKDPLCKTRWNAKIVSQLGEVPDKYLAAELGVSVMAVRRQRATKKGKYARWGMPDEAREYLGKLTDGEMALKYGRSIETTRGWRASAGIPALRVVRPWTEDETKLLGKLPDAVVAKQVMRRQRSVRAKREALGIPEFKPLHRG